MNTDREEDANPCKDYVRWWKCLESNIRIEIPPQRNMLIFTSPATGPRVSENIFRTFTVGMAHFNILSSKFWGFLNAVGICSRKTERISSGEPQCWRP
jgi:hypothetical protein